MGNPIRRNREISPCLSVYIRVRLSASALLSVVLDSSPAVPFVAGSSGSSAPSYSSSSNSPTYLNPVRLAKDQERIIPVAKDPVRSQLVCVSVPPCFITACGPRSAPRASAAEIELTDAGDHSETMMIAQEREQGDFAKMMAAPIGAVRRHSDYSTRKTSTERVFFPEH